MQRNRGVMLTLIAQTFYVVMIVSVQWAEGSLPSSSCLSGELLNESSGFFSSANFPNNYPQYSRCTWNITVPSGYIIKVSFLHFQLGDGWRGGTAQLNITNVPTSVITLDGDFLPDPVYSVGNSMQVIFTSLNRQYSGFNAFYTAITFESVCPGLLTLNNTSGVITSPFYPRPYPNNQACSWQITGSKGKYFVLIIEHMDIQQCEAACTCDYLEIQNGLSSDGVSSPRRCGYLYNVIYRVYHDMLKVQFVSNRPGSNHGFKATYTQVNYTSIPTTCISGQLLNGSSGFFSSPNFPNSYPQYSRCTWNITVPSGYIINVNFLHFQLGDRRSGGAQLTITNVPTGVVTLNGDSLPDAVYSVRNSIQVIFTSLDREYSGFNAYYTAITYESVCPSLLILNNTSGVITSPFYPRPYPNNQTCSWKITASKENYFVLIIEDMFIQQCGATCTCDYLEIQNGLSSDGVSSKRRCGYLDNVIFYVYHDMLKVQFVSDRAGSYHGFKATYTQVNYTSIPATCISGELLNGSSGFFSSPNFPNSYPQYSRCTWNITVPSGYIIKVSFLHFQLGYRRSGGAQLNIKNVPNGVVTLDEDFRPAPVYSVENSIQVIFTSLNRQYSGFNASYTAITFKSVCPGLLTLNNTSGVITSPFYPRPYPTNQTCSWQITASKGKYFVLIIEHMSIQQCGAACPCVYLEIQNGLSSDGVSSKRRCGYLYNVIYHVYHDILKVQFVSDRAGRWDSGFKATYTQVNYTSIPATCFSGELLNESSGFFSSPNFPNNYTQYSRCTWNITVPSGYIIKVSFLHFELGDRRRGGAAQLTITNVPSSVVTLTGDSLPDPVYSVGNSMQVIFASLNRQYSGFNASYTAITFESVCPDLMTLNNTSGVITSPFYPRPYPSYARCNWEITASKGNRIKLVIEDMNIDPWCGQTRYCSCNYLEIQNGSFSSDSVPAERMCGDLMGGVTIYSFYDTLKVLFAIVSSPSSMYWRGFRATYTQLNDTASSECSNYKFLDESNRARTDSGITNLCDTALLGWYRFSGEAGSQMAESCVDSGHCGTDAPGWLNGSHPAVADGAVQRRVCFNHFNNCCYYSTYISVRNCGKFYVYKLDRPPRCSLRYCSNGSPLATECYNYKSLNESNRARTFYNISQNLCDRTLSAGWYRFSGDAGNQMAESCVDWAGHCGTYRPGWLYGSHPAVDDGAVQRKVCFGSYDRCCQFFIYISVRNCGAFFVYKLKPLTRFFFRYCGNGFVPLTAVTPALPKPSSPLKDNIGETEAAVEFVNKKALSNGNPVRYFQMIVIQRIKRKDLGNPADAKYKTIKRKHEDQAEDEPYISAEFSKDESRTTFTVGDGKYYSRSSVTEATRQSRDASTFAKYLNGKLESDTQYAVFQRSFDKDGGYENEGFIEFTTKAKFPTTFIASVVAVVVVLLSILGIGFIVWRRNREKEISTPFWRFSNMMKIQDDLSKR